MAEASVQAPTTWQTVHAAALDRIRSGAWPPGELIPTEVDLAQEFSCARMTVSRALRQLADDGMLDRRRKAGTRVATTPVRRAMLTIPVIRQEVETKGASYRHSLITQEHRIPPNALAARMGLAPGDRLIYLETLHLADGRPHAAETRWINTQAVPGILKAPLDQISANEWLVQNVFYTRGDLALLAEPATKTDAAHLDVREGSALFIVDRLTWIGDQPITAVRLAYPPGHRMTTTL
ncbi:MAG: UTRA domain-containing protein [Pseudomonadota bacterium]